MFFYEQLFVRNIGKVKKKQKKQKKKKKRKNKQRRYLLLTHKKESVAQNRSLCLKDQCNKIRQQKRWLNDVYHADVDDDHFDRYICYQ